MAAWAARGFESLPFCLASFFMSCCSLSISSLYLACAIAMAIIFQLPAANSLFCSSPILNCSSLRLSRMARSPSGLASTVAEGKEVAKWYKNVTFLMAMAAQESVHS